AVHDTAHVDHGEVHGPAAGRPEVRAGRGPLSAHANPDRVPGLHGVLNRELNVREGPVHVPHGVPDVSDCIRALPGRAELVVQQVGRAELVGDGTVAGGEALLEYPLHHRVRGRASLAGGGHLILPRFYPNDLRMNTHTLGRMPQACQAAETGLTSHM